MRFTSSTLWLHLLVNFRLEVSQIFRKQKMIFEFVGGTHGHLQNLWSSAFPLRPQPSAMFAGIDDPARLICDTNPKTSSLGKGFVAS